METFVADTHALAWFLAVASPRNRVSAAPVPSLGPGLETRFLSAAGQRTRAGSAFWGGLRLN
jgi:hypothetical protein